MVVNVTEKYPNGVRGLKRPEALGPFNDDGCIGIVEDLLEPKAVERTGLNAIKVDVVDPDAPGILIDERERRTGYVIDVLNTEAVGKSLCKHCLPGAQIAIKKDMRWSLEPGSEFFGESVGLFFRG
jgi:hypothetical protein